MKFGFAHVPSAVYANVVELVQFAERLGYDYAWIPDQTFFPDPYVVMGLIAAETDTINIGVGVTNPYTRHPAMNARAIASVGIIAPDRIHFGIGAGNRKELVDPLNLDGSHAAGKCREMVEVVRGLLSGKVFNYGGKYFQVDGIKMDFVPASDIPLYIAGRGPKILHAAGEVADGVIIGGLCTPEGIAYALDRVKNGLSNSGRSLSEFRVVSWVTCEITDNREETIQNIKPTVAHIIGGAPLSVLEAIGLPVELMQELKRVYVQEGIPQAAKLVTEQCIRAFTIVGDAVECIARIKQLETAGVTQFSVLMYRGTFEQQKASLDRFAHSIFPAFV